MISYSKALRWGWAILTKSNNHGQQKILHFQSINLDHPSYRRRATRVIFNKSTTLALYIGFISTPIGVLFNLLSITSLFFTLYLPFHTLPPYLSSSYTLTFFTDFSPFHPVELSYLLTLGLISARLLPVLALSFHLALFAISHHLSRSVSESHSTSSPILPFIPLSGYLRREQGTAWRWDWGIRRW